MQKRALGKSGIEIAPLIFGGNVFGWTADERTSFELLDAFVAAGFNCIDLVAAKDLGISVTRVPAYSPYAVAEHAVALLLALNRKIPRASSRVRDLNFSLQGLVGFDLHGKTAGIVGTGKIGRIAAQILRGLV